MRILKKGRQLFGFVFVMLLIALAGGFFWWNWAVGAVTPELKVKSEKLKVEEQIFVVKRGEGISSIAQRLHQEELIRSPLAFRLLVAKEGLVKKIQAGDFRLNPGMTSYQIAQELTHGTLDIWVTIPEGWRAEEIAEEINSKFDPPAGEAGIRNSKFLAVAKGLEGRLFPDTYLIPQEATAGAIVRIFLENFEQKFDAELQKEAADKGLSVDQVLILASIVEREAKHEVDRPIVAGILLKRWQNDWPLQADATVQYAKANQQSAINNQQLETWWPKKLTKQDLQIDSPYNTYLYKGLPPGPICNPGLASIKAVIDFRPTDYWYYLSDASGQMHYAVSHGEHVINIQKYLR